MQVLETIVEMLKREGVEFLACYPATPLIDAAAAGGIRTIVCRQERVGVGIADAYSRVNNGKRFGVFCMQYGPGSENAYPGVASAYSDSSPVLVLPLGHNRDRANVFPHFSSYRGFAGITKYIEDIKLAKQTPDVMRRAFSFLKNGRYGPVMIEIPVDLAMEDIGRATIDYKPVPVTRPAGNPEEIEKAVNQLLKADCPIFFVGQGVLYAEATEELKELAEFLQIPVLTTLEGKSAFPENHPLSCGAGCVTAGRHFRHFMKKADVLLAIGTSLSIHGGGMTVLIPPGKKIIQVTNDWKDINKDHLVDLPIMGDAKLVLGQMLKLVKQRMDGKPKKDDSVVKEITRYREEWMNEWMPKLTSDAVPMSPYRVIWEFMKVVNPDNAIVTHDSGSPRDQIVPFYKSTLPRTYLGWGKSHALGSGLGFIMGAKIARPDRFCVNFMGDAAFGMTGLDFETAVRSNIPITTCVFNNSIMACEKTTLTTSHEKYGTRFIGGDYSAIGKALGGVGERINDPQEIGAAVKRAQQLNSQGKAVLLEFITSEETAYSERAEFLF